MLIKKLSMTAVLAVSLLTSGVAMAKRADLEEAPRTTNFGEPVSSSQLENFRGGFDLIKNDMQLNGTVANNAATNVLTGQNVITEGSFANASGFPMVIQNTGSNVLIQNATIIHIQFQ
jgi:hypothetical protein